MIASDAEPDTAVIRDPNRVVRAVPLEDLRASVTWQDGRWTCVSSKGQPPAPLVSSWTGVDEFPSLTPRGDDGLPAKCGSTGM